MPIYYTILKKDKWGLVECKKEFNTNPNEKIYYDDLYFFNKEKISKYYSFGVYLCEITIQKKDANFKMANCGLGTYRANKYMIGGKYSLFDPATYDIFGLDMTKNKYIFNFGLKYSNLKFLKWIDNEKINLSDDKAMEDSVSAAFDSTNMKIIKWYVRYFQKKINNKQQINFIDIACKYRNTDFLDWWKKMGHDLDYSKETLWEASVRSAEGILNWFEENNMKIQCLVKNKVRDNTRNIFVEEYLLDILMWNYDEHVLNWWLRISKKNPNINLNAMYSHKALENVCTRNNTRAFKWWLKSGLTLKYCEQDIAGIFDFFRCDQIITLWEKIELPFPEREPEKNIDDSDNSDDDRERDANIKKITHIKPKDLNTELINAHCGESEEHEECEECEEDEECE